MKLLIKNTENGANNNTIGRNRENEDLVLKVSHTCINAIYTTLTDSVGINDDLDVSLCISSLISILKFSLAAKEEMVIRMLVENKDILENVRTMQVTAPRLQNQVLVFSSLLLGYFKQSSKKEYVYMVNIPLTSLIDKLRGCTKDYNDVWLALLVLTQDYLNSNIITQTEAEDILISAVNYLTFSSLNNRITSECADVLFNVVKILCSKFITLLVAHVCGPLLSILAQPIQEYIKSNVVKIFQYYLQQKTSISCVLLGSGFLEYLDKYELIYSCLYICTHLYRLCFRS